MSGGRNVPQMDSVSTSGKTLSESIDAAVRKPFTFITRRRSGPSSREEPVRVLLVEDDPETVRVVRQALEAYKRVDFVVETVASTEALREEMARLAMRAEVTGLFSKPFLIESLARGAPGGGGARGGACCPSGRPEGF